MMTMSIGTAVQSKADFYRARVRWPMMFQESNICSSQYHVYRPVSALAPGNYRPELGCGRPM